MEFNEESISSGEMRRLDLNSEFLGVKPIQLMENAGKAVSDIVSGRFEKESQVVVVAGLGRNGGDGMVAARHLASKGFRVTVILTGREDLIKDELVQKNWIILKSMDKSLKLETVKDSQEIKLLSSDILIDAILGTGSKGTPRPPIQQIIGEVNLSKSFKVSVDIPTGVDSDTGEVMGEAVKADLTVTFHKPKRGLKFSKEMAGEIVVANIGIPPEAELYAGPGDVSLVRRRRAAHSHKGDFGRLLIIGGSEVFTGAPAMVGLAALKVGVDLVYIAAPEKTAHTISSYSPNLITIKLTGSHFSSKNISELDNPLEKASAIAVGPGLGSHKDTAEALQEVYTKAGKMAKPMVIDADAIEAYKEFRGKLGSQAPVVLTPHQGEFLKLTGIHPSEDIYKRTEEVRKVAGDWKVTILLKGSVDVISQGDRFRLNRTGNPGMTVGGTGDVLTGIVAAFLAQGFNGFEAAVAGAFINGASGDIVAQERGPHLLSTDLIERIPEVIENPMSAPRFIDTR